MQVLLIVHATAWSDKTCAAKAPIQQLIASGRFDQILEVIQVRPDIRAGRYLQHQGLLLEHAEVSPVPFFREQLFGATPLFPVADHITLVGGVFNATGGGCLNEAFDFLIRSQHRRRQPTRLTLPLRATYREHGHRWSDQPMEVGQVIKDIAWKLLRAHVPFALRVDEEEPVTSGQEALVTVHIETTGLEHSYP